ncbi:MAG: queuosine precursor transporter [Bacteroidales bacterium]|nr:queuosine precursor transporter [Bacteroidales bacterium]
MDDSKLLNKKTLLYLLLASFFIANAMIAEFGGVKIFSVEKLFGLAPLQLNIFGMITDLNLSVGVLIWPIVFVFSDIINEYFGKAGVRRISFITAGMIAYSFIIILIWTGMPPADFWLKLNGIDSQGRAFDINFAYNTIFRAGLGIIVGSLTAFLVSQLVDAYVFHYFKKLTGHKFLWLRSTGSTVISQIIDSFVILFIAFYFLGNWSLEQVFRVGLIQYLYKVFIAIALTPVIYLAHVVIDRYLGEKTSEFIIEEADQEWEK